MYLWDIRRLASRIRANKLTRRQIFAYCIVSPLLSIVSGLFFGILLFSHQLVEYTFKNWLPIDHPYTTYYNYWSVGISLLTVLISLVGIYLCYRANKKGDGKNFWSRMACLNFPINFHIIMYTLATLTIIEIVMYCALQERIIVLQESIWPTTPTTPPTPSEMPTGFFEDWLRTPLAFIKLPLAPLKIKSLFYDIRAVVMLSYPALSIIPPFLSTIQYMIVYRMIKKIARIKPNKAVLPL